MFASSTSSFRNRQITALSEEYLRRVAPAVFAEGAHDSRSTRYGYVPTITVLKSLSEIGYVPTFVTQANPRQEDRLGHAKHMLRLRHRDNLAQTKPDFHEVVLINSHDGTSSYQLMNGIYRQVCSNGMIVWNQEEDVRVSHTGDIAARVVESTLELVKDADEILEGVQEMKSIQLTRPEQLLLAEFALRARFDIDEDAPLEGTIYTPEQFLRTRRSEDRDASLYVTSNVVQENVIRGGVQGYDPENHEYKRTRQIKGIDQNVKLNRMLWKLTERMKELKQS